MIFHIVRVGLALFCSATQSVASQGHGVSELTGPVWRLVAIEPEQEETIEPVSSAVPTISFTDEEDDEGRHRFNGNAGCNRFFGAYVAGNDGSLTVPSPLGATRMACPDPIERVEAAFLAALESTISYEREESELRIRFAEGLLRFSSSPAVK